MQFFIIQVWNELLRGKIYVILSPRGLSFGFKPFVNTNFEGDIFLKSTSMPVNLDATSEAEFAMQRMSKK